MSTSRFLRRHGHTSARRSRLISGDYWMMSPRARRVLWRELNADARRRWIPWMDRPSLASLAGKAKNYAGRYAASRGALLCKAGVVVRELYEREAGRLCWIVTLPDEPLSAAYRIVRRQDGRRELISAEAP